MYSLWFTKKIGWPVCRFCFVLLKGQIKVCRTLSTVGLTSNFTDCPGGLTFTWLGCYFLCLWHEPTQLAHSFLVGSCVCFCLYVALSTVFHSMNFPSNSPRSHSVLPVLFLPYWSFQLYISLKKSLPQPWYNLCGWLGLKHQLTN